MTIDNDENGRGRVDPQSPELSFALAISRGATCCVDQSVDDRVANFHKVWAYGYFKIALAP
jgi:hypothetical protein